MLSTKKTPGSLGGGGADPRSSLEYSRKFLETWVTQAIQRISALRATWQRPGVHMRKPESSPSQYIRWSPGVGARGKKMTNACGGGGGWRETTPAPTSTTPSTPAAGLRYRASDAGRNIGRRNAATRRSARRNGPVTAPSPVKKQRPHRGRWPPSTKNLPWAVDRGPCFFVPEWQAIGKEGLSRGGGGVHWHV